ncbi:hypothetical protein [Alteromonas antoniana]|uniref:hypothetical protein n=1 Tax=Alteromonas antoniana TaxID=2803813 RepID=UPI001C47BA45|nr:hypothetical protein [Alteromonas antoniana]
MNLAVLVPREGSYPSQVIKQGSAIVSMGEPEGMEESVLVYYEGNIHGACNLESFEDKCEIAAGRGLQRYPTTAFLVAEKTDFVEIGTYCPESKEVKISQPSVLEQWT